jgi:hypothetical protein
MINVNKLVRMLLSLFMSVRRWILFTALQYCFSFNLCKEGKKLTLIEKVILTIIIKLKIMIMKSKVKLLEIVFKEAEVMKYFRESKLKKFLLYKMKIKKKIICNAYKLGTKSS